MSCDMEVVFVVLFIKDDEEQVETRHDWGRDVDVVAERLGTVIPTSDWIGSSQDRGTGIERGVDSCLGDRDGLLFHSFVNGNLILDVHLVELVDAADTMVGEHECTCLDAELTRLIVFTDGSRQTSSVRRLSTTVNGSWQELTDVLEELRFGCGRVTDYANIDVTSKLDSIVSHLLDTTKELE